MEIFLEGLKIPDEQVKNELQKMYPQWDFSKVSFDFNKAGERYMNNLYCPIKDESGNPHGYSDWLRVHSMKNGKGGCRKCGKLRMGPDRTDFQDYIDNFPKDRGYNFDQSEFYSEKKDKFPRRFVKNVLCTKHNPPVLFAQDGVSIDNLRKDTTGCPVCRGGEYRGEKKLKEVLIEKGYTDFKKEKKFEDCKSPRESRRCTLLKFDFYLKDKDGKEILVEYDGEQHFKPNAKHGGETEFKERVINDTIKNRYTKERGIKLIRIAYTDFNNLEKEFQDGLDSPDQLYLSSKYPKLGWNDPSNVVESKKREYVISESQLQRMIKNRNLTEASVEGITPLVIKIFRFLNTKKKDVKSKSELQKLIEGYLPHYGIDKNYAPYMMDLYLFNYREDGDYSGLTKDNFVDPRNMKGKKTPNYNAQIFTRAQLPFEGSNLRGYWKSTIDGKIYVVDSYGWYPIYIFKDGKWYEVSNRYSSSTGKHVYAAQPYRWNDEINSNVYLLSPQEMEMVERGASHETVMKNKRDALRSVAPSIISKKTASVKSGYGEDPKISVKYKITSVEEMDDKNVVNVDIYDVLKIEDGKQVPTPENYLKGEIPNLDKEKVESRVERKLRSELRDFMGPRFSGYPEQENVVFRFNHLKK